MKNPPKFFALNNMMDRNGTVTNKSADPPKNHAFVVCLSCGETVRAYSPNHLQTFALRKVMNGHMLRNTIKSADPPKILEETARTPVANGKRFITMATEGANPQKLFAHKKMMDRNGTTTPESADPPKKKKKPV